MIENKTCRILHFLVNFPTSLKTSNSYWKYKICLHKTKVCHLKIILYFCYDINSTFKHIWYNNLAKWGRNPLISPITIICANLNFNYYERVLGLAKYHLTKYIPKSIFVPDKHKYKCWDLLAIWWNVYFLLVICKSSEDRCKTGRKSKISQLSKSVRFSWI